MIGSSLCSRLMLIPSGSSPFRVRSKTSGARDGNRLRWRATGMTIDILSDRAQSHPATSAHHLMRTKTTSVIGRTYLPRNQGLLRCVGHQAFPEFTRGDNPILLLPRKTLTRCRSSAVFRKFLLRCYASLAPARTVLWSPLAREMNRPLAVHAVGECFLARNPGFGRFQCR